MVFRGTTRIPSDCALSFYKRVILWWLLCWKTGGNWRGYKRPSWQTPCSDPSPALSWCMPLYSRGAPAAPPASTLASHSLSGSVPTPCEICPMVSHYRWRQRIQGHHREAARSREKLKEGDSVDSLCLPPNELSARGWFMNNPITFIALGFGMVRTLQTSLSYNILTYPLSPTCSKSYWITVPGMSTPNCGRLGCMF